MWLCANQKTVAELTKLEGKSLVLGTKYSLAGLQLPTLFNMSYLLDACCHQDLYVPLIIPRQTY